MQIRIGFAALILSTACVTTGSGLSDAAKQHARERWAWLGQGQKICFENSRVRSLYLFNNDYSSADPLQFPLPQLQPDFFRNIVEHSRVYQKDQELSTTLAGPVNEALNKRLEEINRGTYNTIYVRVSWSHYIGITPVFGTFAGRSISVNAADRQHAVIVWFPESVGRALLREAVEKSSQDLRFVFDPEGNLLSAPADSMDPLNRWNTFRSHTFQDSVKSPPWASGLVSGELAHSGKCTSTVSGKVDGGAAPPN